MLKIRTYFRIFSVVILFALLATTVAFAAPDKSIIEESVTLTMDNYIDEPDISFIVKQTLEGALLKLREGKKMESIEDPPQGNSATDKKSAVNLIKKGLVILSDQSGIPYKDLEYAALKNLASSLDPHSSFLTPGEMRDLADLQKGVFAGIGMEVTIKDNVLTVVSPLDDSPAAAAGILAGDQIIQIDDMPTKDVALTRAVSLIRGKPGSSLKLTIMRKGFDQPRVFNIKRASIIIKSIKYKELEDRICYIRITSFQSNAAEKLEEALNILGSRQNKIKGLIIDLRNNPGGLLDQAVKVADKFIDNDLIITVKGRNTSNEVKYSGRTLGTHPQFPVVVLINRGSASAAEIFAGTLHSYGRAILIGEKTFGKGTVQTVYPLSDGSGLKLTTSRYYLPSGAPVGQGIIPDISVEEKEGQDYPLFAAQSSLQAIIKKGYASREQLITALKQEISPSASSLPQPKDGNIYLAKPSIAAAAGIWTENDMAVIVGVENYQDLPKADYSAGDARLVKDYLIALGFKERNIELLLNERATLSAIKKTLETWLYNRTKKNSRVIIYYSGHGAPDAASGSAYLVPYDGDPNYLSDTGYPLQRLYDKMGRLPAKEVIVLLDSCFSGAGGRSVLARGARPLVMSAENPVVGANMVVLSASAGSQISTSSPEKRHGIFTYYFLKALNDGRKNIVEIYEYIKPQIEDDAKQLNVKQSPAIQPNVEKLKGKFYLSK